MDKKDKSIPFKFDNECALEGVFCPVCGQWHDDYYGMPEKCSKCGQPCDCTTVYKDGMVI
mgnify:CR=1 FL=1